VVQAVVNYALTFAVGVILTAALAAIKNYRHREVAGAKADKYLLKDRITQACFSSLNKGSIHAYELESLLDMFRVYEGLGGNSYVHLLVGKVMELPVETS